MYMYIHYIIYRQEYIICTCKCRCTYKFVLFAHAHALVYKEILQWLGYLFSASHCWWWVIVLLVRRWAYVDEYDSTTVRVCLWWISQGLEQLAYVSHCPKQLSISFTYVVCSAHFIPAVWCTLSINCLPYINIHMWTDAKVHVHVYRCTCHAHFRGSLHTTKLLLCIHVHPMEIFWLEEASTHWYMYIYIKLKEKSKQLYLHT